MSRRSLSVTILLAVLVCAWTAPAWAGSPLTVDMMVVALRPELPGDRNYLTYVVALMDEGQVPRDLVESTFLWARKKPQHKYRYFRGALILRAAALGIHLPENDPPVTGTIEGRAVYIVKLGLVTVEIPLSGGTVTIKGTRLEATTDNQGNFSFAQVPFGVYSVQARGKVLLVNREGSVQVTLPTRPPSLDPARALISVR